MRCSSVIVSDRDFVRVVVDPLEKDPLELPHDRVLEEALGALVTEGLNHAAEYTGYRDTVKLDVRALGRPMTVGRAGRTGRFRRRSA
jgi:hypothetical protein